jgi:WD40 repeat protein
MFKILAKIDIGYADPTAGASLQMSYRNVSTDRIVTITGPGIFRWIEVNNGMNGFTVMRNQLAV